MCRICDVEQACLNVGMTSQQSRDIGDEAKAFLAKTQRLLMDAVDTSPLIGTHPLARFMLSSSIMDIIIEEMESGIELLGATRDRQRKSRDQSRGRSRGV